MAPLAQSVKPASGHEALLRARQQAALLPDCLVEAQRVANTVIAGWHGRRKRGIGENFWQFRPYVPGESLGRIDWRRSARDDHTYVRDREWEAAHTIWLWADDSPSMLFKSELGLSSKENRALVVILALAEILSRSGERIAYPGVIDPVAARNGAERLATALALTPPRTGFPSFQAISRQSDLVIVSDFLDPAEEIVGRIDPIGRRGVRGHLLEVCDPVEESFPYSGRTEFHDPETGGKLTIGRAEAVREEYRRAYLARRDNIATATRRLGWSYTTHHTDRPASEALIALHMYLSGIPGSGAAARTRKG